MGQFAIIDDKFAGDVGSLGGWSAFCNWADVLNLDKYSELIYLCEHGWSDNLQKLRRQLATAMGDDSSKRAGVRQVGNALLASLDKVGSNAEYIIISDGRDGADLEGAEPEEDDEY